MSNAGGDDKKNKKASLKSEIRFSSLHAWGLSYFLSAFWGSDDSRCNRQGLQHEYDQLARNRIHNDSYPAQWPLLPWGWVSFQGSAEPWVSRSQQPAQVCSRWLPCQLDLALLEGLAPVLEWQMFSNGHLENPEILTLICSVYPFPWCKYPHHGNFKPLM